MSSGKHKFDTVTYRPTSLDFINHPNPIEPHAQVQKHPLDKTPRHESARIEALTPASSSQPDLFSLILEPSEERPVKRLKATENVLDLPRLPVRNPAKRLRIPPTLSGLHQPPPDAGLLPSINVENLRVPSHSNVQPLRQKENLPVPPGQAVKAVVTKERVPALSIAKESGDLPKTSDASAKKRPKRNPWTEEETEDLLKGVAKFGIGQWTKILKCADFQFTRRTALDLKDRFRVYCPEDYRNGRSRNAGESGRVTEDAAAADGKNASDESTFVGDVARRSSTKFPATPRDSVPHRVTKSKLISLGIEEPFAKAARRSRHGYTPGEDDAILKGFRRYGNSWASIRSDPALGLSNRKATDLRDRFRTRFPEEYAKAGLAPRAEKASGIPRKDTTKVIGGRQDDQKPGQLSPPDSTDAALASKLASAVEPHTVSTTAFATSHNNNNVASKSHLHRPQQPSLFTLDDIFLGAPSSFSQDYDYTEPDGSSSPIILDRGILDWATADAARTNNAAANTTSSSNAEVSAREAVTQSGGIDPLMTLVLPRPAGLSLVGGSGAVGTGMQTGQVNLNLNVNSTANVSTSLPSLADLLPMDSAISANSTSEQLELPSLMQWYTGTLTEERGSAAVVGGAGGNLTLEELLS